MSLEIRRRSFLGQKEDTLVAGYDNSRWGSGIQYLDRVAAEEAADKGAKVQEQIYMAGGMQQQERHLIDSHGIPIAMYYLKEIDDEE